MLMFIQKLDQDIKRLEPEVRVEVVVQVGPLDGYSDPMKLLLDSIQVGV